MELAWRPTAEFTEKFPGPVIRPSAVSTLAALSPGQPAQAISMTATIDPDAVPGLRDVFLARFHHRVLVTKTTWCTSSDPEEEMPPTAILHVRFPEVDVAFNLVFDVMRFTRQLIATAASGYVTLIDPHLEQALQTKSPEEAMHDGLFVRLEASKREPLVRILQQYFDLPLDAIDESLLKCPRAGSSADMAAFAQGARVPSQFGVWTWPGRRPVLFLVDEGVAELEHELHGDDGPKAAWEVIRDDEHVLARLDAADDGRQLASWLLADPPTHVVRAAASGPHEVVILSEPPPEGDQPPREHGAPVAALIVTVPTTSVAMGTLLPDAS